MPSAGIALTGSSSPRPAIIMAVTCLHERRAPARGTIGGGARVLVAAAGSFDLVQVLERAIDGREVLLRPAPALSCRRWPRWRP